MSCNLPHFPNLDYLKKRAKSLLRELQRRNPGAKLTQAQHAIAREYGFSSWPKLKVHIESLPQLAIEPEPDPGPAHGGLGGGGTTAGSLEPDGREAAVVSSHASQRKPGSLSFARGSDSPFSSKCRRILEQAGKEADRLGHQKISTGHL